MLPHRQSGFAPGLNRPAGTLVTPTESSPRESNERRSCSPVHAAAFVEKLESAEEEYAVGDLIGAERRLKDLQEHGSAIPPLLAARLLFALANVNAALARLSVADGYYQECCQMLEAEVSTTDPSLVPCLLNRGCLLVRRRRFRAAVYTLRRAWKISSSLLGAPRLALLRSRVLHALGTAYEGSKELAEAEAAYREALAAAEEDEKMVGTNREKIAIELSLAALLQARGHHEGAWKLLEVARCSMRNRGGLPASEMAHVAGRAAISALATQRNKQAKLALVDAVKRLCPSGSMPSPALLAEASSLELARMALAAQQATTAQRST